MYVCDVAERWTGKAEKGETGARSATSAKTSEMLCVFVVWIAEMCKAKKKMPRRIKKKINKYVIIIYYFP